MPYGTLYVNPTISYLSTRQDINPTVFIVPTFEESDVIFVLWVVFFLQKTLDVLKNIFWKNFFKSTRKGPGSSCSL